MSNFHDARKVHEIMEPMKGPKGVVGGTYLYSGIPIEEMLAKMGDGARSFYKEFSRSLKEKDFNDLENSL